MPDRDRARTQVTEPPGLGPASWEGDVVAVGRHGLKVTRICLGTATFGDRTPEHAANEILDLAYDAGVRFVDTSNSYPPKPGLLGEAERILGRWMASRRRRDDLTIATKVNYPVGPGPNGRGLSRKHLFDAVDASLRRLGVEYIDLYQAHQFDDTCPVEETLDAFDRLVQNGKVRYVGVCNWPAWRVVEALWTAERRRFVAPISVQVRYNLLRRDAEVETLPMAARLGVGVLAYNPLAAGLLTGRYRLGEQAPPGSRFGDTGLSSRGVSMGESYRRRYWTAGHFDAVERYRRFCSERGYDMATTAVAWVMHQPNVTSVLIGASEPAQLPPLLRAAQVRLSKDDLAVLDDLWWQLPRHREE